MVSDFITEHDGYLTLTDVEYEQGKQHHPNLEKTAQVLFKFGAQSEGYWNSEKFVTQMERAIQIAEVKYPRETYSLVFILDQSSGIQLIPVMPSMSER